MSLIAAATLLVACGASAPKVEPSFVRADEPLGDAVGRGLPGRGPPVATLTLGGDAGMCAVHPQLAIETQAETGCTDFARDPVTRSMRRDLEAAGEGLLVWLGDNLYPDGLVEKQPLRDQQEVVLQRQIDAAGEAGLLFLAGNHDWHQRPARREGERRVDAQHEYIHAARGDSGLVRRVEVARRDLGARLAVVGYDSETAIGGSDSQRQEILAALDAAVSGAAADGRQIVLAAHHALESVGEHAYKKRIYGAWFLRNLIKADMRDRRYGRWRVALADAVDRWIRPDGVAAGRLLALAAGHDHSVQVLQRAGLTQLISGAAAKLDTVRGLQPAGRVRYAAAAPGYLNLHEAADGAITVEVVEIGAGPPPSERCQPIDGGYHRCRAAELALAPAAPEGAAGD